MKLSILMSTRNDPIGTAITFNSFKEDCKYIDHEFIIVDNSEDAEMHKVLKSYISSEYEEDGEVILLRSSPPCIFTAREKGLEYVTGDVVLLLDSHMLAGYDSCQAFLNFFTAHTEESVGFVYGPCGYHHKVESFSYHSRKLTNFGAIIYDYAELPSELPISFRGVPLAFRPSHFNRIGKYGTFSRFHLPWGGGDTHLGLKSLVLGYRNWLIRDGYVMHLGPFPKDEHYFAQSYAGKAKTLEQRWIGFLIAAYIAGGKELLKVRKGHVEARLNKKKLGDDIVQKAMDYAEQEKEFVDANRVYEFNYLRDSAPYMEGYVEPRIIWNREFKSTWRNFNVGKEQKGKKVPKRIHKKNTSKVVPGTDWRALIRGGNASV